MNIMIVDDEKRAGEYLQSRFLKLDPPIKAELFMNAYDALQFAKKNMADAAFLDIEMEDMTGMQLARKLKALSAGTRIIFVTGYSRYAVEAFSLHADGYLLKPVTTEELQREIDYVFDGNNSVAERKLQIVTFGNFAARVNGELLKFGRRKSRELLAYLVDRKGSPITSGEAMGILWEDRKPDASLRSQYQTVVCDMMATLKRAGVNNVIIKSRNNMRIDTNKIECDYYEFLKGNVNARNSFVGEYMSNYSWGEYTAAFLNKKENEKRNTKTDCEF